MSEKCQQRTQALRQRTNFPICRASWSTIASRLSSVVSVAPRPFRLFVRILGSTVRRVIFGKGAHNGRPFGRHKTTVPTYRSVCWRGSKALPDDVKARIAGESLEPGAIVTDVARRHGCRPQQVHEWRRRARLGQLTLPVSADTLSFVPLVSESLLPAAMESSGSPEAAVVMVELQGARVEIRGTPGVAVLSDVFIALRRTRSC
jgi:transposase